MNATIAYRFPGTEKQGQFISKLVAERGIDIQTIPRPNTFDEVKLVIDSLLAIPLPEPENAPALHGDGDGLYDLDGSLYSVKTGRNGKTWAYFVTEEGKQGEYFGHPRKLAGAKRLTVEEYAVIARERHFSHCVRCNRTLTLKESIERMMGAVCASKI